MFVSYLNGAFQRNRFKSIPRWIAPFFISQRADLAKVLMLSMIAIALSFAQPMLTKQIIDNGVLAKDIDALIISGLSMFAITLVSPLVGYYTRHFYVSASTQISQRMREALFKQVLKFRATDLAYYHRGDLLTRLDGDLSEVQRFAMDTVMSSINSVVILVGTIAILGSMNFWLTLFVVSIFFLNTFILKFVRPRLERVSKQSRELGVALSSYLVERIGAIRHIQGNSAEEHEVLKLKGLHKNIYDCSLDVQAVGYMVSALPNLVITTGIVIIFVCGGIAVVNEAGMTLGMLVAFTTYAQRISGPLQSFSGVYVAWQRAKISVNRIIPILEVVSAAEKRILDGEPAGADRLGEIVVSNMSFAYPNSLKRIIDRASFIIGKGQKIQITAPSGSGKSTLIDLLVGQQLPLEGNVVVCGADISSQSLEFIRKHVKVVSGEPVLFTGSLLDNITYGNPGADLAEVKHIVEMLGLDKDFGCVENYHNYRIGYDGRALSVGQRQRVALGSALLAKPAILILDEALSGVEIVLEKYILNQIDAHYPSMTKVYVSHRVDSESNYDFRILIGSGNLSVLDETTA